MSTFVDARVVTEISLFRVDSGQHDLLGFLYSTRQPLDPAESEMSTKLAICSVNDLFKLCQPLSQCGWTGL